MNEARLAFVPPVPRNLNELANTLEDSDMFENFYRGAVTAPDGSMALIFISNTMENALHDAKHLLADGSFDVMKSCSLALLHCTKV